MKQICNFKHFNLSTIFCFNEVLVHGALAQVPGLCMSNSATTKVMFYVLISLVTSKKTSGMQGRIRLILMFFVTKTVLMSWKFRG